MTGDRGKAKAKWQMAKSKWPSANARGRLAVSFSASRLRSHAALSNPCLCSPEGCATVATGERGSASHPWKAGPSSCTPAGCPNQNAQRSRQRSLSPDAGCRMPLAECRRPKIEEPDGHGTDAATGQAVQARNVPFALCALVLCSRPQCRLVSGPGARCPVPSAFPGLCRGLFLVQGDETGVSVDREACSVDRKACSVDRKARAVDRGTRSVDQRPCSVDREARQVDRGTCSVDQRPCSVDREARQVDRGTCSVDRKARSVDRAARWRDAKGWSRDQARRSRPRPESFGGVDTCFSRRCDLSAALLLALGGVDILSALGPPSARCLPPDV